MILWLLWATQVLAATLDQDLLSTTLLGQDASRLGAPMSGCTMRQRGSLMQRPMQLMQCPMQLMGQRATVTYLLSDAAGQQGVAMIIGYDVVFDNATTRGQALAVLNPLLQNFDGLYPNYERDDRSGSTSWYFANAARSVTMVEFVSPDGLENRVSFMTRLTALKSPALRPQTRLDPFFLKAPAL